MALIKDLKSELRETGYRGAVRVNSRVKVAVEWNEAGQTRRAEGYTRDISPKGCLAVVPRGFSVGDRVRLVNLANQAPAKRSWSGADMKGTRVGSLAWNCRMRRGTSGEWTFKAVARHRARCSWNVREQEAEFSTGPAKIPLFSLLRNASET